MPSCHCIQSYELLKMVHFWSTLHRNAYFLLSSCVYNLANVRIHLLATQTCFYCCCDLVLDPRTLIHDPDVTILKT